MSNMLDYLRWRGDLELTRDPFGEVDGLIFSELSYFRLESVPSLALPVPLKELPSLLRGRDFAKSRSAEQDKTLLELLASGRRFREALLCEYTHELDDNIGMQFAAMTFLLPDQTLFLAFRGTDGTLTGWKEDFSMAFSPAVPAQQMAQDYTASIAGQIDLPLRLGGHSKGGNLAVYAAATVPEEVRRRIRSVWTYDGPGLNPEVFHSASYAAVEERIHSYVPEASVIGMLLMHPEKYVTVKSDSGGIAQHYPFTWQTMGPSFVHARELTEGSRSMENATAQWLRSVSESERREFVDALFRVLETSESNKIGPEMLIGFLKNPAALTGAIRQMSPQVWQNLLRLLQALIGPNTK